MGRTSKFSFPMPGRKNKEEPPLKPPGVAGNNLSKAQRILGTDSDLNIDSPTREVDHAWKYPGSRSSGMSISISESTQSTNESGSIHEHQSEQWEHESGVLPRNSRFFGKASSTLMGRRPSDDRTTTTASSASGRLRNEDSSSTLKSYYDRQKSPLSISQQTSASSARDLALRKGFPPVVQVQRSPLLQVESALDPFNEQFAKGTYIEQQVEEESQEKSKKKPARLDLSMLFPRSKRPGSMTPSPSSITTNTSRETAMHSESGRRKLKKSNSKESMQSHKGSMRSTNSHDTEHRQAHITPLASIYDHYEQMPVRSPHMDRIPESRVLDTDPKIQSRSQVLANQKLNRDSYASTTEHQPFSWKNVRASMISPPWESSSAASISSRNTRTSRHTNSSVLSNSDLQEKSVLSLSSDSEDDGSDREAVQSLSDLGQSSRKTADTSRSSALPNDNPRTQSTQHRGGLTTRSQNRKVSNNKETPYLEVPNSRSSNSRPSGSRMQPERERTISPAPQKEQPRSSQKEKRVSKAPSSTKSERSLQQPTPPISPTSVEFRQASDRSSRFMAVTKQEEALLEALRQKRARMREKIIEEHETAKTPSPPRIPPRSSASRTSTSSINTVRGLPHGKQKMSSKVLLYLDTPASETQFIDAAEPSPDLSDMGDFLSYGDTDEDSTPRSSWAPPRRGQPRPDSLVSPQAKFDQYSPMTPPSAARLSAVGVRAYKDDRQASQSLVTKKRSTGVRFLDHESRLVNAQDFLLDGNENEVLWRL